MFDVSFAELLVVLVVAFVLIDENDWISFSQNVRLLLQKWHKMKAELYTTFSDIYQPDLYDITDLVGKKSIEQESLAVQPEPLVVSSEENGPATITKTDV
jgi:hypothetical protein